MHCLQVTTRVAARPSLREGFPAQADPHVDLDEVEHLQGVTFNSISNL